MSDYNKNSQFESNGQDKSNYPDYIEKVFNIVVPNGQTPERIDTFLTHSIANATRNRVQKAIDDGNVTINSKLVKVSRKVQPNDIIICKILKAPPIELVPENIPLKIVYEDEYLLLVNKPAGMVSHPGFGNRYGTLVNALLYYFGVRESISLEFDPEDEDDNEGLVFASDSVRPGLVHRLDKDTSGLIIISKNPEIHAKLAAHFANRTVYKEYWAIVWGDIKDDHGFIEGDIGRSPRDRKLFAVVKKGGKPALTEYSVESRFEYLTLLRIKLHTGRTHQIRVHLTEKKHPILCDPAYGGDNICFGGNNPKFRAKIDKIMKQIKRQLLHAKAIKFIHPVTNQEISVNTELPEDFQFVLNELKN